ncbi:MAG: hypothetical protein KAH57_08335 [Thermoplasmata archaeon]|nr:hypothetical protein [Thermoplasmata archaeon]
MDIRSETVEINSSFIDMIHRRSLLRRGIIDEGTLTDLESQDSNMAKKKVIMHLRR